jgi:hypothetical protein
MGVKFRLMVRRRELVPTVQVKRRRRKLHEEKLHNIYAATSTIWKINSKGKKMGGTCGTRMPKIRNARTVFVGKP